MVDEGRSGATAGLRRVFSEIYAQRSWGPGESASGPGSSRRRVASFLDKILDLVRELKIESLLDAPCGDFNWVGPVSDAVECYYGIDIVPELIRSNRQNHPSPRRHFLCRDLVNEDLPAADFVLCRDALVHFSFGDARRAIENLRRTGARYLLTTTFVGDRENREIESGGWRPLNLERSPFLFPSPQKLIDEGCDHTGGIYRDKGLGLWRFEDIGSLDQEG